MLNEIQELEHTDSLLKLNDKKSRNNCQNAPFPAFRKASFGESYTNKMLAITMLHCILMTFCFLFTEDYT